VSVDLSRRWLDKIPQHLALNDLSEQGHVRLTGDVFDWLRRLVKRGERFELIILDPPSTSVGKTKRRWSAKRDYPELIALALPLLAEGGRLFTATNHRQLTPHRFAQLVASALPQHIQLERVCAPSIDFPTNGPMSVKNLIWKA
jgi:23S rRNA (cytosine1962-C5)-methyltransferase